MGDMKNTTCKACGKRYHICGSCDSGGVEYMYDGYCSRSCYDTLSLVERLRLECEDEAADEIERLLLGRLSYMALSLAVNEWFLNKISDDELRTQILMFQDESIDE